jgi:hypothetical protein
MAENGSPPEFDTHVAHPGQQAPAGGDIPAGRRG